MKKIYVLAIALMAVVAGAKAQQFPDPHFEDWSSSFNGDAQLKNWHGSNVSQAGFDFTFMYQKTGRSGYCAYVADREVGAFGITETGPGYMGLGTAWSYLEGLSTKTATAGTYGGISWKYRPDTMAIWIKRTGDNTGKEDFHLLYYSWKGNTKGDQYKNKQGDCTSVTQTNEESDVRQELDGNECGTSTKATQVAEGWYRAREQYDNWTQIKVPIYYMNSEVPTMCNVIFSAGNYPNFRANSGLYAGNGLYVDDVELIYSSKIQMLYIDNKEWKGFDPDSEEEQTYSLGEKATVLPTIEAWRGAGQLTNVRNKTVTFNGRKLSGSEITITNGVIDGAPTTITVKSEDGKSQHVYKIKFVRAASTNANLAGINVNGKPLVGFKGTTTNYNVELDFGTTAAPVVDVVQAEDAQTVAITQAKSPTGTATIVVTAADKKTTKTYTLKFSVAQLKDNTLQNILVNGEGIAGFVPAQTIYKVSLPLGTTTMPKIEAVSAYPKGAQTIVHTAPDKIDGGTYQISVTSPGNQTPKVYKLNFKIEASTYSKLKELKMEANGINYLADFDPDILTYYVNLPIGTTKLPAITWVKGDPYQAEPEIQDGGLDGTTRVVVTAASGAQTIYKIIVSTEKSDNSSLKNIFIGGKALDGFSPATLKYTYDLGVGVSAIPTITYTQGDEFQTVTVTYGGANEVTRVTVVAGDGSTTIYQITFAVKKSDNCKLADIQVGGKTIEGFNPETLEYTYTLAKGAAIPAVQAVKAESSQTINERKVTAAPGDYKLTVVAESGAKQTYIIHFVLNLSANADLKAILLDGEAMPGFVATTIDYEYTLPVGQSIIPEVGFQKGDNGQKVIVSENNNVYTLQVTAENGSNTRTYTVKFIIQVSQNAFLAGIKLDGKSLEGFAEETFKYEYTLTGGIPVIEPVKADPGQQVTVAAPVGAGTATIRVADEAGTGSNTYYIVFKKADSYAVQLKNIFQNGTPLTGWDAAKEDYVVIYHHTLPVITYEKNGEYQQTVSQIEAKDDEGKPVTYIHVSAGGETKIYTITYSHEASKDATLAGIWLNGQPISEPWNPATLNYTRKLQDGEAVPTISYAKKEDAQTVLFGQKEESVYQIVVLSASTTDTTTYTLTFEQRDLYANTQLKKIYLDGNDITDKFSKSNTYDGGNIPEGSMLPPVTYEKDKGQTVLVSDVAANQQQIIVVAENGASATYTINYHITKGTDVKLTGILLDGDRLKNFDPDQSTYTVTLPERTAAVSAVTPQSNVVGQTYTITYGRVNARTTIEVLAKDGQTKGYYYIDFMVKPLTDTRLAKLELAGKTLMTDPTVLEYTDTLPFNVESVPEVEFEKSEPEQKIEYTRGRGGETWIKVTAQSGDSRTYHVQFVRQTPVEANVLKSIAVNGDNVALKDTIEYELPFGATEMTITYKTNYVGQAVVLNNGGVTAPSQLIVIANHPDVPDKVYTVIPKQQRYNKNGKLASLTFNNQPVPNFQPDVYNYVVNVTKQPSANDFVAKDFNGNTVSGTDLNAKKKQILFKVTNGATYTVSWYYTNCEPPFDMSGAWVNAAKAGYKPTSAWKVPGDYTKGYNWNNFGVNLTYEAGKEVMPGGVNGVLLSTIRGASMNGSLPGMMTLGAMSISLTSSGGSTSSVTCNATAGINFYNTPEQLAFDFRPLNKENVDSWNCWITMSDGSTYTKTSFGGSFDSLNVMRSRVVRIDYKDTKNAVSKMNILLNSCHTENAGDMGYSWPKTTQNTSDLMLQNIRFVYSAAFDWVKVDGNNASINGKNITYEIADEEYVKFPEVTVKGAVEDQEQLFTWADEVLEGDKMVRRATLRNFGEDHSFTDYNLAISRPAVTDNTLSALYWNGTNIWTGQPKVTVARVTPYDIFPDVEIVKSSVHQKVTVSRNGDVFTITVTPEFGDAAVYTVELADPTDNVATIAVTNKEITDFSADKFDYEVKGDMPIIKYNEPNYFKTIVMTHTEDSAILAVTAADKATRNTYRFRKPAQATSAELEFVDFDGKRQNNPAVGRKEVTEMPEIALFGRKNAIDSVAQTIAEDSIEWRVFGSDSKRNTYTFVNITDLSNDTLLAAVLVNGENYEKFDPTTDQPTVIPTDSMINLEFIASNIDQTLTITLQQAANAPVRGQVAPRRTAKMQSIIFNVHVMAADKSASKDYVFRLEAPRSSDATLQAIIIGTDTVTNIGQKTVYTLPIAAGAKKENPTMPRVQIIPADPQASVALTPACINGSNYIVVTPADNSSEMQYELVIEGGKSTYAQLDGIMIDGTPLPDFASDRYYYSVEVEPGQHEVIPSSQDKFQTVAQEQVNKNIIINVIAEDGVHSERYMVELYEASKSNNATLRGINVSGEPIADFEPMNNSYIYNLDPTAKVLPDVQGVMAVDGQSVEITKAKSKEGYEQIILHVTAPDEEAKNQYTITFQRQLSDDVTLKMIMLDGDSLDGFKPEQKIYQIALPVGQNELPAIYAQRNTGLQKMPVITTGDLQAEITVTAENGAVGEYTLLFNKTYSYADSLLAIYADNKIIDGFAPRNFYYALTLPVEAAGFPELTWEEATEFQSVRLDTLQMDSVKMMCQIEVIADTTALNKLKNIYTITYDRELWAVDTLQMIYVDNKPIENFSATQHDYSVILPAGTTELPLVTYDNNEKHKQHITFAEAVDSIATKSLNKKINVIVTAENGKSRTYTIHFPIELSSEAGLNIIQYGGQMLENFDAERSNYTVLLPVDAKDVPVITVGKKEDAQRVDINTKDWTVTIDVLAEDGMNTKQYVIDFQPAKSDNALLSELVYIFPDHADSVAVLPDVFEYAVLLPLGVDSLPKIDVVKTDSLQTVSILPAQPAGEGNYVASILVTAPDEETQLEYQVTFSFSRNNDARLTMIYLDTVPLEGFHADSLEYDIIWASGTEKEQYYTLNDIKYTLSDKQAKDTAWIDAEYTVFIEVTAQDGTRNTYSLRQSTALSDDNFLEDLLLDSVTIRDFDPETLFYTYYLPNGVSTTPKVEGVAHHAAATVDVKPGEAIGDTTLVMCTAENGDVRIYRILFTYTHIDDSQKPKAQDVLVKRIYGTTQIFVASLRSNVAFALYDRNGHMVEFIQRLPVCDPNDAILDVDANGQEFLLDVVGQTSGEIITLNPNTIYFYCFLENAERRVDSGKLIIVNSPAVK